MSQPGERHAVIARLRDEIRRIERRPGRRVGIVPCGLAHVDAALPQGGFPRGAISELTGGPASGKTGVALALLASLGPAELAAYVDARGELYPPAAAACGVDLDRLLLVRPAAAGRDAPPGAARWRAALWACEALLSSGAFGAVAMDVPVPARIEGGDAAARRLQAAAERGGAIGLWLSCGGGLRVPAAVRLELRAADGIVTVRRAGGAAPVVVCASGGGRAA